MMSKSNLLAAFVGGAAAGAVIALLVAPQSGAETRKKLVKAKNMSAEYVDDLIQQGKETWYQAKGKAKMGAGIAADEIDEFLRTVLGKGEKAFNRAKDTASNMAEDAQNAAERTVQNGKRGAQRLAGDAEANMG